MTRTEKLECIKKYRHYLYARLRKYVPNLINDPDNATSRDICIYNKIIAAAADKEQNNAFKKNFSF